MATTPAPFDPGPAGIFDLFDPEIFDTEAQGRDFYELPLDLKVRKTRKARTRR